MNIGARYEEDVVILDLEGRLTIGEGDVQLREKIREILDEGVVRLIVNLERVKTMDSSGLGELLRCKRTAEERGATIKLLHVQEGVYDVLEITRLIGMFEIFDHELAAIASFRPDAGEGVR